jgi:hypothetical protein
VVSSVITVVFIAGCGWCAVLGCVARRTVCCKGCTAWRGDVEACSPVAWRTSSRSLFSAQLLKREECIVFGPLLVVDEAFIGLLDLVEFFLLLLLQGGICDLVGMALENEFAVGGLDDGGVGRLVDA